MKVAILLTCQTRALLWAFKVFAECLDFMSSPKNSRLGGREKIGPFRMNARGEREYTHVNEFSI